MRNIKLIYGPMFSGKSAYLINLIEESESNNKRFLVFKPTSDKRTNNIYSRNGKTYDAISINEINEIFNYDLKGIEQVFIDEINFFTKPFLGDLIKISKLDIQLIISGLERDYRAVYFPFVKQVLDVVEDKILLKGKCFFCEDDSLYTGRKRNGKFDSFNSQIIVSENLENNVIEYFSSCKKHHPFMRKNEKNEG